MNSINRPKITIIIPTLQKNITVLTMLLNQLISDKTVEEIIVIDNSKKGLNKKSNKLKVIIPDKNLYVNPAWNLGVKESKNQYIGIINDDLIFSENFISQILDFLIKTENIGIIGLDTIKPTNPDAFDEYPKESNLEFLKCDERCISWGSAMVLEKSSYYEIPEEIKIWFGDDFLFEKNKEHKKINYRIKNSNIKHLHSLTSDAEEFDKIKKKDEKMYYKIFPQYNKKNTMFNVWSKIFSIKNQYRNGKKCKILTIFGIKMKTCQQ